MDKKCFAVISSYPWTCGVHNVVLDEYRIASADTLEEIDQAKNYATGYVCPVGDKMVHVVTDN